MDRKKLFLEETSKKKDSWRSGAEVAEELRRLAAEIADGVVKIGGEKLPVGDSFSLVMKKQLKKGVIFCEFLLEAPVAGKTQQIVIRPEEGGNLRKYPAAGGKKLKKEISRLWKELVKHVNEESVVPDELCVGLLRKMEDYNLSADGQWSEAWLRCADKVKFCIAAAKKGDFFLAREAVVEVNQQTGECHRLYK